MVKPMTQKGIRRYLLDIVVDMSVYGGNDLSINPADINMYNGGIINLRGEVLKPWSSWSDIEGGYPNSQDWSVLWYRLNAWHKFLLFLQLRKHHKIKMNNKCAELYRSALIKF